MYANFTIAQFIIYVNECIHKDRCHIGWSNGAPDTLFIWAPHDEPGTVYFETFIGRANEYFKMRGRLSAQYTHLAKHRNGIFKKYRINQT